MKVHEIKSWPESFQPMRQRVKLAEFRRDDRGYEVGDTLVIREWMPAGHISWVGVIADAMRSEEERDAPPSDGEYTGEVEFARVTHKVEGGTFGVPEGYCVLSIWPMALISGGGPSAASLQGDQPHSPAPQFMRP